ncbi:MAG: tricarballylate utilization 4Fe-4S protein TcuB [Aquabacterium sp.]
MTAPAAQHDGRHDAVPGVIARLGALAAEAEVDRQLRICNACRYCEGYCAVFPALMQRLTYTPADVHYLANLCHNCGACLHACQYASPHEFAVNLPQAMAVVRQRTYTAYAWPAPLGRLVRRHGMVVSLVLVVSMLLVLALAAAGGGPLWRVTGAGAFYEVLPHGMLVGLFAPAFGFAVLALGLGVRRFWRDQGEATAPARAWKRATRRALTLRHLGGGHGEGCPNDDDAYTPWRRVAHHLTFYGFALCFASTVAGTVMHYVVALPAPYGLVSVPKLLGLPGGAMLLVGSLAQLALYQRRDPRLKDPQQAGMDRALMALLAGIAATGLALPALHGHPALPLTLCAHLALVLTLFVTMPYGKLAHGVYRMAALLKRAAERNRPGPAVDGGG